MCPVLPFSSYLGCPALLMTPQICSHELGVGLWPWHPSSRVLVPVDPSRWESADALTDTYTTPAAPQALKTAFAGDRFIDRFSRGS
jgi:hypothetical protein